MTRRFVRMALFAVAFSMNASTALAQEPAFFSGIRAIRFEEAPGAFHYVFPCKLPPAGEALPPQFTPGGDSRPHLCWPALLGRAQSTDGQTTSPTPVAGVLAVSESEVRFIPNDPKSDSPMPATPVSNLSFRYDSRQLIARVRTKNEDYLFAFQAVCIACTPGASSIDVRKADQLAGEYGDFEDSLSHFAAVLNRITTLAAPMRIGVTPKNQPTTAEVPEAMGLYADLNRRFAALCSEPAKSCVQSYANYQACKSGMPTKECGEPPACSAFCALTPEASQALKIGVCTSPNQDSASLIPDWSEVAKKMDSERLARGPVDLTTMHFSNAPTHLLALSPQPLAEHARPRKP